MATGSSCFNFKIIFVGDEGVGKTTFIERHKTGKFKNDHIATIGLEVRTIRYETNLGVVTLNCWDTAGKGPFFGLGDAYYFNADAAIIMFDVTRRNTYKSLGNWYKDVTNVCPNIPIVVCGNKSESKEKALKSYNIFFHRKKNLQYYDISSKTNYNHQKPLLYLLRKLMGNEVRFVPLVTPPEKIIDCEELEQWKEELKHANTIPLPEEEKESL